MAIGIRQSHERLAQTLIERYPEEAARILESSPVEESAALFTALPPEQAKGVLERVTPDLGSRVMGEVSTGTAARLLSAHDPHRAAALLSRLDTERRQRILDTMELQTARDLGTLMEYEPDTAGGLMDPNVTTFRLDATVRDVIRRLRTLRHKRIIDVFLIDDEGRLTGSVAIQDVVLAEREERLETLVRGPTPSVQATSPREEVTGVLEEHRVASLPVVDFDGRLLGVLRQHELIETTREEATADLVTMVGVSKDERALSSPWFAVRKRLPWLQINLLTAFLAASVVGLFEGTIARFTALAVLLPVVAGQSGNTGAQALAVTMRGLALREIRLHHWVRVGGKELATGALNGVLVALTTAVGVYVWSRSAGLMLVIGISMVISMVAASLAGATIPMILTAARQDPAQSSSVILTTVTDVVGFFSFLAIATALATML